jgi:hypothetical protein
MIPPISNNCTIPPPPGWACNKTAFSVNIVSSFYIKD